MTLKALGALNVGIKCLNDLCDTSACLKLQIKHALSDSGFSQSECFETLYACQSFYKFSGQPIYGKQEADGRYRVPIVGFGNGVCLIRRLSPV